MASPQRNINNNNISEQHDQSEFKFDNDASNYNESPDFNGGGLGEAGDLSRDSIKSAAKYDDGGLGVNFDGDPEDGGPFGQAPDQLED